MQVAFEYVSKPCESVQVRETCFNVQSSRSHQIVTIMLESRRSSTSPKPASDSAQLTTKVAGLLPDSSTMHSTITFVDLAGSEPAASHISDAARIKYASTGPLPDDKQRKLEVCYRTRLCYQVIIDCSSRSHWPCITTTSRQYAECQDKSEPADLEEGDHDVGGQAGW